MTEEHHIVPDDGTRNPAYRVSKSEPCPICDHDGWCLSDHDLWAICMRTESDVRFDMGGRDGYLHRLREPQSKTKRSSPLSSQLKQKPKPEPKEREALSELMPKPGDPCAGGEVVALYRYGGNCWEIRVEWYHENGTRKNKAIWPLTRQHNRYWITSHVIDQDPRDPDKGTEREGERFFTARFLHEQDIAESHTLIIHEGCKAAEAAYALEEHLPEGWLNTKLYGSIAALSDERRAALDGKTIVIIQDNDEAGEKTAARWALDLSPLCDCVKIIRLPNLPPAADMYDQIQMDKDPKVTAELLMKLVDEAQEWAPEVKIEPLDPGAEVEWKFVEADELPPFPIHLLPVWCADHAMEVAASLQMPVDVPCTLMLGMLGASAGPKLKIRAMHRTPERSAVLWTLAALPTGSGKSGVMGAVTDPIMQLEGRSRGIHSAGEPEREAEREILAKQATKVKELASRGDPNAPGELAEIMRQLAQIRKDCIAPRRVTQDFTIAALISLMHENDGVMSVITPEGGLFNRIADGRFNQTEDLEAYLKAYSGEELMVDRSSNGGRHEYVQRACLPMIATPQPEVIQKLTRRLDLQPTGFLSRWIYCLPGDFNGHRKFDYRKAEWHHKDEYARNMTQLLEIPWDEDDRGHKRPHTLRLDDEAACLIADEQGRWEEFHLPKHPLYDLRDWASKANGMIIRLAGLLWAAEHGNSALWRAPEIAGVQYAVRAIGLAGYFLQHAAKAYRLMRLLDERSRSDGFQPDAASIYDWMVRVCEKKRNWRLKFTSSDILGGPARRWPKDERPRRRDVAVYALIDAGVVEAPNGWGPGTTAKGRASFIQVATR